MLCKMNHNILKEIYGDRCTVLELHKSSIHGLKAIVNAFRGYIDGVCPESIAMAMRNIQLMSIDKVFIDGSNLGEFARVIKKIFPNIQIYTFFHNVEARFFWGAFRHARTLPAMAVMMVNYLTEKKAVRFSDEIICLSNRDSKLLERIYGRHATQVTPIALQDQFPPAAALYTTEVKEKFALFVGGAFYANLEGIRWFVKHVTPHISIKTFIVGRGFDEYKTELECTGKVKVVGEVESLAQWYADSYFVIAPVFDGSGMKTKVAEALMFGKKIIGTPEAFSGYEKIVNTAGCVCVTAIDFVAAIDSAHEIVSAPFDPELRSIYEVKYSYNAARSRIEGILN